MNRDEIAERVIEFLADDMDIPKTDISESSCFKDDFGFDSLDAVEVIMELEDRFEVEIADDVWAKVVTVGDVIRLIEGKIGEE